MPEYIRLYPRQTDSNACLFRIEEARKLVVRSDVKDDTCSRCGKFDEMKALQSGLYNRPEITVKQDFIGSWEHFPIISLKARQFLDPIVGDAIKYFDLATSSDYYIALPVHVILPDVGSRSFRAMNQCPMCGRYSELIWGATPFNMTSEITIGVFHLENRAGITPVWVVSKSVSVSLLKVRPRLKGFVTDPLTSVVKLHELPSK